MYVLRGMFYEVFERYVTSVLYVCGLSCYGMGLQCERKISDNFCLFCLCVWT